MLIVSACFGTQTCIHMKANALNDIYFFGRMLYNEFLQNIHLVPESNINITPFYDPFKLQIQINGEIGSVLDLIHTT